jgi:hypothetical protein
MEAIGGQCETVAVTGNGRLTVGINEFGQILSCRWPGPGHANQVSSSSGSRNKVEPARLRGMTWGIRSGGRIVWLDGTNQTNSVQSVAQEVPVVQTQSHMEGLAGAITQETFVYGDADILVTRLRISPAIEGEAIWYADASPRTALVPELPILEGLCSGARDFAAFVDESIVYHVRPTELTSLDWDEAQRWAQNPGAASPDFLGREGVWIAYTSPDGFLAAACGAVSDRGANGEFQSGGASAFGDCASSAAPRFVEREGERIATVVVTIGNSRDEVDRNIAFALEQGYDGLLRATRDAWNPVLDGAVQRLSPTSPELQPPFVRALATVFAATSQESGAIVRVAADRPILALDYPRHSIWAGLALDYLGLTETSERHLRFLLSHVRTEDGPGMPAGSIPAALYGDGTPGLPHVVLDADASGWLLWAVEQHTGNLGDAEREPFVTDVWAHIQHLADFLMVRSDPGAGMPMYAFNPRSLREASTEESLIAHFMGLRSAAVLSQIVREVRPEWGVRIDELEDAVANQAFSSDGAWVAERPLSFWATGILDAEDPRWAAVSNDVLENVNRVAPDRAMRDLCDLALLWQNQPERLERLKPALIPVIARANAARPLDTLDAARSILSILIVSGV